jgi:hypothetical protein
VWGDAEGDAGSRDHARPVKGFGVPERIHTRSYQLEEVHFQKGANSQGNEILGDPRTTAV